MDDAPVDIPSASSQLLAERRAEGSSGLSDVAALIGARFGTGCLIYLRSDARNALVPVAFHHPDPGVAARFEEFIGAQSAFSSTRLVATLQVGGSVLISGTPEQLDAWMGAPVHGHAASTGLRSLLAVPVQDAAAGVIGALVIGRHDPERLDEHDRGALQALATSLASAIDHERLAWELRERTEAAARTERELFLADRRFTAAFRDSPFAQALFSLGPGSSMLLAVNRRLATLLGTTEEALLQHASPNAFVHPEDVVHGQHALGRLLAGEADVCTIEQRAVTGSGSSLWCECSLSLVRDAGGEPLYGLCQIVDVSAQRQNEERLARHVRCQRVLASIGRRAVEGAGWEELAAATVGEVAGALETQPACVFASASDGPATTVACAGGDPPGPATALPAEPVLLDARRLPPEWLAHGSRGAVVAPIGGHTPPRAWLVALSRSEDAFQPDDVGFVEAAAHVLAASEERRAAEERVRRRALLDVLTELPNRTLFSDRVAHAAARAEREGTSLGVVCIDVDRFKDVNDTFGHAIGDELIRALALRLAGVLRTDDTLARIGGDEFGVLCEVIGDERGAIAVVHRIMEAFADPVVIDERALHVTASLGIAVAEGGRTTAEGLVRDADTALHRAKERRGMAFELFDRAMRRRVVERLGLEQDLRRALVHDELVLHYQPLVSLRERRIVGVEALVRWQHPQRGLVSPAAFIPIAEDTGLIVELGRWVLGEACRRHALWRSDPALPPIYMSVNLSGRQLAVPGIAEEIAAILERAGVAPGELALELTETVLMEETDAPAAVLHSLHELGVHLLLDDFGTGYSSLNYVRRFPLHAVKVDRSFIAGIADGEADRAMLRAIVSMAGALGISVIAEGVETLEQASWLASMDCDVAQGFGLARPAPAEAIEPLLRSGLAPDRLRWSPAPPVS